MTKRVAIVGAGMGGLACALRLRQRGHDVTVLEARSSAGGLASSFELDGLRFDYGPYVLLDAPGLRWVFEELDVPLDLMVVDAVYEVLFDDGKAVRFYRDLDRTASGMDHTWPGSGRRYSRLVERLARIYRDTQPLQFVSRPGLGALVRHGAARHAIFFLRGLESVLAGSGLPREILDAVMIWTHIAGQPTRDAPAPLALVPALIHGGGAYYPRGGMGSLPSSLETSARERGVRFVYDSKVRAVHPEGEGFRVELASGPLTFDAVVSNAHGVGTYLSLVPSTPPKVASELDALPLQPPGYCEYLKVKGESPPTYLRFRLTGDQRCRVFVDTRYLEPSASASAWHAARLIKSSADVSNDAWWSDSLEAFEVVARRSPSDWGREFHLHRDSMNPVMTASFMRRGRLAHRSPHVPGLYLAGSSTHPGQWVSFCAISGVLAADCVDEDSRR